MKTKVIHSTTATGTTLSFEAPEGRPSADGSVTVYDPRYAFDDTANNPIVTGVAARKAVSTTLTAAAGVSQSNRRNVPCVPPAVLVIGDFVIVQNVSLQRERGQVRKIGTAAIELEEELQFDYATADTIVSAVMTSPALTNAFLRDEDNLGENYYARWSYTVGGVTYGATTRFDLVREPFRSNVQDSDLLDRYPDLQRVWRFKNHPDTLQPIIDEAARDVEVVLQISGYDPDKVRGAELVDRLVLYRAFALIALHGGHPPAREAEAYRDDMVSEWEYLRRQIVDKKIIIPYDRNEDDHLSPGEQRGASVVVLRR